MQTNPTAEERCPTCCGTGYDEEGDLTEPGLSRRFTCEDCKGTGKMSEAVKPPADQAARPATGVEPVSDDELAAMDQFASTLDHVTHPYIAKSAAEIRSLRQQLAGAIHWKESFAGIGEAQAAIIKTLEAKLAAARAEAERRREALHEAIARIETSNPQDLDDMDRTNWVNGLRAACEMILVEMEGTYDATPPQEPRT